MKNYLILLDLEGVHGVVGEPYKGLEPDCADYFVATENAVKEINAVVKALFEEGADNVYVWDNHGSGTNIDFSKVDKRAKKAIFNYTPTTRMDFIKDLNLTANIFLGYHSMEGSLNGVLAHTYDSGANQYYKLNGKQLGEFEIDSILAAEYGVPAIFSASDDVALKQMKEFYPSIVTVETKKGLGRNKAIYKDEDLVLKEIYEGVKKAVNQPAKPCDFKFPAKLEVRYTRMEWTADYYEKIKNVYKLDVSYGEDCHVLQAEVKNPFEIKIFF